MRCMISVLLLVFILVCPVTMTVSAADAERITQADLLRRLIDLNRLTMPPAGERTGMFSSYDRRARIDTRGNYVDWDADNDYGQFLRATTDGWQVMAEMEGPGAITRIWSADPHGQVRLILDGKPVIEADFADLFSGKLSPFEEPLCYVTPGGGHNCYFPIGYNKSCQVLIRAGTSRYQINHVAFSPGTQVETFKRQLDDPTAQALHETAMAFLIGLSDKQLLGEARSYPVVRRSVLDSGETISIETFGGGGIIRALYVAITDQSPLKVPYALHRCILRIYFDNQERPSVEVPLIDFFGSGFDMARHNSLLCGTDKAIDMPPSRHPIESRFMYCHFPMPFSDIARVEIESHFRRKLGLMLWALVERGQPPAETLRFNAHFRKEDPCRVFDYPLLETTGHGRIVGCTLNVDCPRQAWWGAGDDKIWIDGEAFPSYFGTDSAGYLGDGNRLHIHAKPLQGVTCTGPYGRNSGYRWQINDCVNFEKSVRFTVENWQEEQARDTYYGSVVYWYGELGATHGFQPLTIEQLSPPGLRIPGAVEVEGHIISEGWGNLIKEKHARGVELSGQLAAVIATREPVLVNIPSERERAACLKVRIHPRRPFESIELRNTTGGMVGTVVYDRQTEGIYTFGTVNLRAGDNHFTLLCSKKAILDCWILEDLPSANTDP